jgi:hypothetical protein
MIPIAPGKAQRFQIGKSCRETSNKLPTNCKALLHKQKVFYQFSALACPVSAGYNFKVVTADRTPLSIRNIVAFSVILIAGLFLGSWIPVFLKSVAAWGHFIPSSDLASDYFDGIVWAAFFTALIALSAIPEADKKVLLWLWLAKCVVTLVLMLLYENNYGLDSYYYFESSKLPYIDWTQLSWGNGTALMTVFCWVLYRLPAMASYHAIKVAISFVGLAAVYIFYLGSIEFSKKKDLRFLYVLGLFPSVLFWSSILGKDPINLLGVAIYFYGFMTFLRKRQFRYVAMMALGISIAAIIRIWYGLILTGPLLILFFHREKSARSRAGTAIRWLVVAGVLLAEYYFTQLIQARMGISDVNSGVYQIGLMSRSWAHGGSTLGTPGFTTLTGMLKFSPLGMFTALFRPLPGEVFNAFGLIAGLENALLLVFCVWTFRKVRFRGIRENFCWSFAFTLILTWAFFYGFISYQNLGSAVRFKLQILPIILILLHGIINKKATLSCAQ